MSDSSRLSEDRTAGDDPASVYEPGSAAGAPLDDLPPVKPPSAGFIVQLFVVPALIVLAIVAVIGLFGQLSESEQDWRELVQELRSPNEHRRWRAAHGLAHLLSADQQLPAAEQRLTQNPRIAEALVSLLDEQLASHTTRDDDLKQQAYLARTLSVLDVPGTVLPALQRTMQSGHDREVRKEAIASVAVIFGRRSAAAGRGAAGDEAEFPLTPPGLVDDVIEISRDSDPLIRQLAAYTLGLVPAEESRHRLEVLLNDADPDTQANAAIGLARQRSTAGWPVFRRVLADGPNAVPVSLPPADPNRPSNPERDAAVSQLLALDNSLKAVGELADKWAPEQRRELQTLIKALAEDHAEPRIRTDARQALIELGKARDP